MFQGCVRGRGSHVWSLPCNTGEHKVLVTESPGGQWGPPGAGQELCGAQPGQELPDGGLEHHQEVASAGPQVQIQVWVCHSY